MHPEILTRRSQQYLADAERVERDGVAALSAAADADALEDGAHRRSSATATGSVKALQEALKAIAKDDKPRRRASASTRRARGSSRCTPNEDVARPRAATARAATI